jgi:hypothetical protein
VTNFWRSEVKLLFAKDLGDGTNAMVIDTGYGKLLGGVAVLVEAQYRFDNHSRPYKHWVESQPRQLSSELRHSWVWWKYIDKPEDFENRGWEHPPEQVSQIKYLEEPRG